jgi:hypothetical protein
MSKIIDFWYADPSFDPWNDKRKLFGWYKQNIWQKKRFE